MNNSTSKHIISNEQDRTNVLSSLYHEDNDIKSLTFYWKFD